ncbi:MAG TPA: divalent metal cation transporter [Actinomycetota bacterium]|jgi:NRAMP (natural resistance-associated macrophage protein)-like metal ion transporter|nr:divalent metal cation transporter [Actinomycetota bacterium]
MRRVIAITLGIMASIGGFFDMGEIVMTAESGARFGFGHVWVVALGTLGIILYAEMAGRIAVLSRRPVFDIVRERLGARIGFMNLSASFLINVLTLVAEIAGLALAFELLSGIAYYLWVPVAVLLVFFIIWRVSFELMERSIGIVGLVMIVFAVAFWQLGPDWSDVATKIVRPEIPASETTALYWYFAIAIFGAAMTPYEVFFYSSGAVEERWSRQDLVTNRATAYIGFFVGGFLATSSIGVAALVLGPRGISVEDLSTITLGPASVLGRLGLAAIIVGLFASTTGAALEVTLATGYSAAQYFGWAWGKFVRPRDAARFHLVMIASLVVAGLLVVSSLDPIKVTELAVVFSAIGLPLTYLPVLVVANDRGYMGSQVNGRALNLVASAYLVVILAASLAAIPLMIWTKMGS